MFKQIIVKHDHIMVSFKQTMVNFDQYMEYIAILWSCLTIIWFLTNINIVKIETYYVDLEYDYAQPYFFSTIYYFQNKLKFAL